MIVSIKALNEKGRCCTLIAFQIDIFSFSADVKNSRKCISTPQRVCMAWCLIMQVIIVKIFFLWRCGRTRAVAFSFMRFLDHTQWRTTFGRTPLDEWSANRRDLYLTTHNTQEKNIHAPGRIRTHNLSRRAGATNAIHRAATGTGQR
jgi:hypothetical protein